MALERIKGTRDNDTIEGTANDDGIAGCPGDDVINAGDGDDRLLGGDGNDLLNGEAGSDRINDGTGNDTLNGGDGADTLRAGYGNDELNGGDGDDVIISLGDGGEPEPAQAQDEGLGDPNADANDTLTGGDGADQFVFRPLINATEDILAKHTNEDGSIKWKGVAGENDNVHDHWVEGIGDDVITDFDASEGDTIVIPGHTADASISYGDSDGDGEDDYTLITLTSNQGGMGVVGGAHDGDPLGTITVEGAILTLDDIDVFPGSLAGIDRIEPHYRPPSGDEAG
jgi:Ca2+-binding RTX toxin-like protein